MLCLNQCLIAFEKISLQYCQIVALSGFKEIYVHKVYAEWTTLFHFHQTLKQFNL